MRTFFLSLCDYSNQTLSLHFIKDDKVVVMRVKIVLILFMVLSVLFSYATHQRAAQISYVWKGGNDYEFTLTTYTYSLSAAGIERDSLLMRWGDGTESFVPRIVYQDLGDNYTLNVYKYTHTFSSSGSYVISMEDPNRNYGVVNVPNSVMVPMYVETELVINPFLGCNNSVQMLNAPIDQGCVGKLFMHSPGAYDPDGDSLSYRLISCRGYDGEPIPGYVLPQASDVFVMDSVTGELRWDSPMLQGEYNVAFIIEEWRSGVKVGSTMRDMQILISACDNDPPSLYGVSDTCVEAGKPMQLRVYADDPNGDVVTLTASGALLEFPNNAAVLVPEQDQGTNAELVLYWTPDCSQVSKTPYLMTYKAKDSGNTVSLSNFKNVFVSVVGPAVEGLVAQPEGFNIVLTWDNYHCEDVSALLLYRRYGAYPYNPEPCEIGIRDGYELVTRIEDPLLCRYVDDNDGEGMVQGVVYSYRMVAVFRDGSHSKVSDESCAHLTNDLPMMTHVSNDSANLEMGKILVSWTPPKEIDLEQFDGPLCYKLFRSTPNGEVMLMQTMGIEDTLFVDNTPSLWEERRLTYRVELHNGQHGVVGSSREASAVLLAASGRDNAVVLDWSVDVPWIIDSTEIFRYSDGAAVRLASVVGSSYVDNDVENDVTYSYYVRTLGHYMIPGVVAPLVNYSQIVSVEPKDNVPPVKPYLLVDTDCEAHANMLSWHFGDEKPDDIAGYNIYYAANAMTDYILLDSIKFSTDTSYLHLVDASVVGCYYIMAYDDDFNVSMPSDTVCVDYMTCPPYELPNVFTPNNDGYNDLFCPKNYVASAVYSVDVTIMNRWGGVVFHTDDPAIEWDGKNHNTGQDCPAGTYFYVCQIIIESLEGPVSLRLQGSVNIVR